MPGPAATAVGNVRFSEQLALPFVGLLQHLPPCDQGVVRGIEAAIVHVITDRIVDTSNQAVRNSQPDGGRKEALGDTVGDVDPLGVAPLRNDVAVPHHQASRPATGFQIAD